MTGLVPRLRKFANTSATSHRCRHSRASAGSRAAGFQPFAPGFRVSPGQALAARFRGHTGLWKLLPEVATELDLRRRFARPGRRRPGMSSWVRFVKIGPHGFAVFAVFPRNYQRARRCVRQKSWAPGDAASKKQRKHPLFRRCFSLFLHQRTATIGKIALIP